MNKEQIFTGQDDLQEALESLHTTLVFDPSDWAVSNRKAWIYGIVIGWGDVLESVAKAIGWTDETVERLKKYHNAVEAYRKGTEQHSNLYQLFQEIFGFELSERSHDIIEESIGYTLIHEGVPLKKIVQIAKAYYDEHEWARDDIPYCFVTGLHNEGLI
ncbi:hypothetical protein [Brevibacillus fortis]|uniref:Uncharacterized protein n=1 Tax=Brevibacillus fortis TaxID=2126352 RepID=A0A2P7V3V4_9BACL|nr:hypothetical protein [Brevibacillus fortis]PSJ93867.1 hypothetical protein C7R93_16940 [Brevibacillus fortis]